MARRELEGYWQPPEHARRAGEAGLERGYPVAVEANLERATPLITRSEAVPWWSIDLAIVGGGVAAAPADRSLTESLLAQTPRALTSYPDGGGAAHPAGPG
jgi:hypothetical protein